MPFLPTLAIVIALAAASLCPTSNPTSTTAAIETKAVAVPEPLASAPHEAATPPYRAPAVIAFAEFYRMDTAILAEAGASTVPVAQAASPTRSIARFAAAARRQCPGRRCAEPATALATRAPAPIASRGVIADGPAADGPFPALALPFAAVAEAVAPAVHLVGEASSLMRNGAASLTGSVGMLAECLP